MAKQNDGETKSEKENDENKGKVVRKGREKPLFKLNEHTATVKLVDRKGWNRVTHSPRDASSMLDIFVVEEAEVYSVFYFDWDDDKWKTATCSTFDEIIGRYSYDRERG